MASATEKPPVLVSTDYVMARMASLEGESTLRLLHAGLVNAKESYEAKHIPTAMLFDLSVMKDQNSPYKNMLPPEAEFAE